MSSNQSNPILAFGHIVKVMHPHPTLSLSFLFRLMRCRWFEADGVLYRKARYNYVLVRLPLHVNAPILWWCSLSSRGGKRRVPATIRGGRLYGQLSTERHSCCGGGRRVWVNELVHFTACDSLFEHSFRHTYRPYRWLLSRFSTCVDRVIAHVVDDLEYGYAEKWAICIATWGPESDAGKRRTCNATEWACDAHEPLI